MARPPGVRGDRAAGGDPHRGRGGIRHRAQRRPRPARRRARRAAPGAAPGAEPAGLRAGRGARPARRGRGGRVRRLRGGRRDRHRRASAMPGCYRSAADPGFLGSKAFAQHLDYRPAAALYIGLLHTVFGLHTSWHLAWAITLAVLMSLLTFAVLRVLRVGRLSAGAVALLVLIYPRRAPCDSGAPTASAASPVVVYLVGLLLVLRGFREEGRRALPWHVGGSLLYLFSLLSYEITAGLVIVGVLIYRLYRGAWRPALRRWVWDLDRPRRLAGARAVTRLEAAAAGVRRSARPRADDLRSGDRSRRRQHRPDRGAADRGSGRDRAARRRGRARDGLAAAAHGRASARPASLARRRAGRGRPDRGGVRAVRPSRGVLLAAPGGRGQSRQYPAPPSGSCSCWSPRGSWSGRSR